MSNLKLDYWCPSCEAAWASSGGEILLCYLCGELGAPRQIFLCNAFYHTNEETT